MDISNFVSYESGTSLFGILILLFLMSILIYSVVYFIGIIGLWGVFRKAGKCGWDAIIPFYSHWVLVEISGLNWWWFLLSLAPLLLSFFGLTFLGIIASFLATFNCYYNLSKKFHKGTFFAICLTLFNPICIAILGLNKKCVYDNSVKVNNNGIFNETDINMSYQNGNDNSCVQNEPTFNRQQIFFCGSCGNKLENGVIYCSKCGKKI